MPFTANAAVGARPPAQFQVKWAAALPADLLSVRFRAASMLSKRTSPREEFAPKRPSFPCCNRRALRPYRRGLRPNGRASGCSSGVEHNLAKVGVGRSNRLTRSSFLQGIKQTKGRGSPRLFRVWGLARIPNPTGPQNCACAVGEGRLRLPPRISRTGTRITRYFLSAGSVSIRKVSAAHQTWVACQRDCRAPFAGHPATI